MKSNKHQFIVIYISVSIAILATGCKKILEIDNPKNSVTAATAFGNDADAKSSMAGIFSQLENNSASMGIGNGAVSLYAGMSSDELVPRTGQLFPNDYQFYINRILPISNFLADNFVWNSGYQIIYQTNAAIENLNSASSLVNDGLKKKFTGEAKFVRAFSLFYLTNLYGDIPLPLSTDFRQTEKLSKTAQKDVYDQIIKDLKDAETMLPDDYSLGGGERIRPNKATASALLARVYLYLKDWKNAELKSSEVITDARFSLTPDLHEVFNKNSEEAIWQLKQDPTFKPTFNATWDGYNFSTLFNWDDIDTGTQEYYLDPSNYEAGAFAFVPNYNLSDQLIKAFEDNDQRKAIWTRHTPSPKEAPYNGYVYYSSFKYTLQTGFNGDAVPQYYMMFRLAEQLLIRAEARAEQNNISGATEDINLIRFRAGLPATPASGQSAVLGAIAHERQVELFAEWGHRWFDLKRTGQATSVLGAIPEKKPFSSNGLLFPIPKDEIVRDPNLKQNPGY